MRRLFVAALAFLIVALTVHKSMAGAAFWTSEAPDAVHAMHSAKSGELMPCHGDEGGCCAPAECSFMCATFTAPPAPVSERIARQIEKADLAGLRESLMTGQQAPPPAPPPRAIA